MECEESGSSLGEQEDLRAETARAMKRLKELCVHLRRGEDDSGLQSDCDESMLVIVNNTTETEEANTNGQDTLPNSVRGHGVTHSSFVPRLPVSCAPRREFCSTPTKTRRKRSAHRSRQPSDRR